MEQWLRRKGSLAVSNDGQTRRNGVPTGRQRIKLLSAKERARDSYTVAHECKEDVVRSSHLITLLRHCGVIGLRPRFPTGSFSGRASRVSASFIADPSPWSGVNNVHSPEAC